MSQPIVAGMELGSLFQGNQAAGWAVLWLTRDWTLLNNCIVVASKKEETTLISKKLFSRWTICGTAICRLNLDISDFPDYLAFWNWFFEVALHILPFLVLLFLLKKINILNIYKYALCKPRCFGCFCWNTYQWVDLLTKSIQIKTIKHILSPIYNEEQVACS